MSIYEFGFSKICILLCVFFGEHNWLNSNLKIKFMCLLYTFSIYLKQIGYGVVDWVRLPQGRDDLWVLVDTAMNFGFHTQVDSYWAAVWPLTSCCFLKCVPERYCGSCLKTPPTVRFNFLQCNSQLSYICSRIENFVWSGCIVQHIFDLTFLFCWKKRTDVLPHLSYSHLTAPFDFGYSHRWEVHFKGSNIN